MIWLQVENSEILGVLNGGGGSGVRIPAGMGSAAEEKAANGWSEDEADTLLSLVGGWRLDEYGGGGGGGGGGGPGGGNMIITNGHCSSNGVAINSNGVMSNGGVGVPPASCVLHAMPHVCWCEVCTKVLCRVCTQVSVRERLGLYNY
jgi:hypothetical protein